MKIDWRLVAGGAVSVIGIGWLLATAPRIIEDPPQPRGWRELKGDPVHLVKGIRYRACVRMSFLNPLRLVSLASLTEKITAAGFSNVIVTESLPSGWPSLDCDRFIEATWNAADKDLARPSVVELAWANDAS